MYTCQLLDEINEGDLQVKGQGYRDLCINTCTLLLKKYNNISKLFICFRAAKVKCQNYAYPDKYGHYREAKYCQTKHHWFWKVSHYTNYCALYYTTLLSCALNYPKLLYSTLHCYALHYTNVLLCSSLLFPDVRG